MGDHPVRIRSFEQPFVGTAVGTMREVEVEYVTNGGTHVGLTTSPGAWTSLGRVFVAEARFGEPVPIPLPIDIDIAPGAVQGFRIISATLDGEPFLVAEIVGVTAVMSTLVLG